MVETFHLYQGLGCLFNSKVTQCLNPYFPFVTDSSSASRKRKYLKLSQTAVKNALTGLFWHLEIGLKRLVFILVPGPESELSSVTDFLCSSQKKKVSCGNVRYCVEKPRMFQPMNWPVSYTPLYPVYPVYPFQSCSFPFLHFLHALLHLVIPLSFPSVLSLHLSVGSGLHCSCKHIYCVNIAVAKQLKTVTGACQQPARSLVH